MNPKSAIQKGKLLEEYVCEQLREKGIDLKAYRSHGSGNGNVEKSDIWTSVMILGQNVGFECKNQATLHIPDWWRQTKKLEKLGREPILVFKQFGEPLLETKVVIYLDTLLELIKASRSTEDSPKTLSKNVVEPQNDRSIKYALDRAVIAVKSLLKEMEK